MSEIEPSKKKAEIREVVERLKIYNERFYIGEQLDVHGWTLLLKEKESPRTIIISKPDKSDVFLVRSTEEWHDIMNRKHLRHLYSQDNLKSITDLIKEVGDVISGKDIASKYLSPEE